MLALTHSVMQRTLSAQRPELWAFTGPWDPQSNASVRANGSKLDAIVTGWIGLDSVTGQPLLPSPYPDTIRLRLRTAAKRSRRMVIVTSWHGQRFHPGTVRGLARDAQLLGRCAGIVAARAEQMKYRGVVLDFEALDPTDREALVRVARAFRDSAHAHGISPVTLAVPAADSASYPLRPLLGAVDLALVMLYDQHWAGSEPGPIADPEWVRATLASRVSEAGPGRLVAALPTYGYRWRTGKPTEEVTLAGARRLAARANVMLTRDPRSRTLHAARQGEWELWVTDAEQLRVLAREAARAGVGRVALWRLGQEDPAIWKIF
jgi:spore germination protein YaaH